MAGWDDVTGDGWDAVEADGSGPGAAEIEPGQGQDEPDPAAEDGAGDGDDDLLADLFGEERKADLPKGPDALADASADAAPDGNGFLVEPVVEEKRRLSLAEKMERQRAASVGLDHTQMETAGAAAHSAQRHENADRLWGYVYQVLGYLGQQQDLQNELKDIIITRDHTQDLAQRRRLEELVRPRLAQAQVEIANTADIPLVFDMLLDEWTGISVLGPLWRDDDITEIMVDSWDRVVVEKDGALQRTPIRFRDKRHAMEVARELSQKISDRAVNESNPIVTAELPGARLHFAVGKVVRSGLSISIRKFRPLMGVEQLMEVGAFNQEMADFLSDAIGKGRANVLVSGGTGSGKTTMLNAVSSFIPATERVVTIEDAFELTLQNEMVVPMQTKEAATADSTSSVSMGDLLRSSLRMRPDRIVVGEIRGPEAQVMLQAANTGHDGTMSTIHANDPTGCLSFRLPDMLLQAREMPAQVARRQVASAIDLVVQIGKVAGRRFVTAIAEVDVADITEDSVQPHLLFEGELGADGNPVHRRVGALRTGTELAIKMRNYGADVDRWATAIADASDEPATGGEPPSGDGVVGEPGSSAPPELRNEAVPDDRAGESEEQGGRGDGEDDQPGGAPAGGGSNESEPDDTSSDDDNSGRQSERQGERRSTPGPADGQPAGSPAGDDQLGHLGALGASLDDEGASLDDEDAALDDGSGWEQVAEAATAFDDDSHSGDGSDTDQHVTDTSHDSHGGEAEGHRT